MPNTSNALDGVLVIALEQAVAAPLCTARLAEGGARVIKIERAEGDFARGYDHVVNGDSAYFVWLNRGKESLVLDIKQAADAALLARLLARADVFVQNLAPGAAARSGFGAAELRARHPRLITCDISGYGSAGPAREMKAYDLLIQCESGLASVTGSADSPGRVGVSAADIACGMNAHAAILEALIARERSGEGAAIEVSLFDSIADWMTVPLLHHDYAGTAPRRVGLKHPSIAPYGAFACRDGREIVIAVQNEREWRRLCETVLGDESIAGDPRFAGNAARVANRPQVDAIVAAALAGFGHDEAVARLQVADIAYGSVNGVGDLSRHSQLRRIEVKSPGGSVAMPAPPAIFDAIRRGVGAVPGLGEHSAALRSEFGGAIE
ncbi:CaiB/BaiF CoA-transferase family protein [Novosphingobium sp. Gsoil 351]|uniref:CaiB/BaiF CoA transferase family protein n=1 Tax=Novosphingobium sp. Gsoil 351 TaxID=2675225 RepID=UPI0012B4660C|nr:CaiB/BaiF CoA-transferase family protein [Novosphingobium sp. Gsoil 351]QGN55875.1 CoA transferase [Novosphingobium sp. Gsoil 351]